MKSPIPLSSAMLPAIADPDPTIANPVEMLMHTKMKDMKKIKRAAVVFAKTHLTSMDDMLGFMIDVTEISHNNTPNYQDVLYLFRGDESLTNLIVDNQDPNKIRHTRGFWRRLWCAIVFAAQDFWAGLLAGLGIK